MDNPSNQLLDGIAAYYTQKIQHHGTTPRGVDWNGQQSQYVRFQQLEKIIEKKCDFTINDLGCGYGAFLDFLYDNHDSFSYLGIDVSAAMISAAKEHFAKATNAQFIISAIPDHIADYGVASGIFNVRQNHSDTEWGEYIEATLDVLDKTSRLGFSFNCLTSYSDDDKMREYLYYADPCPLFDLCKRRYSRNIALLHDYGLYEFTILIRKSDDCRR